jgi:hypothetical protein
LISSSCASLLRSDPPPGVSSDALGSGGCNDGRPANALHGWWCLQGSPPGASPALGLSPCRSVRYAAFVSGVGPGCRPRPWDGRSASGAPTSWIGSNALTPPGRPRTDSFRNGDPAAQGGCKGQRRASPWFASAQPLLSGRGASGAGPADRLRSTRPAAPGSCSRRPGPVRRPPASPARPRPGLE